MKRRNFFATLLGSLFVGKAVAANPPIIDELPVGITSTELGYLRGIENSIQDQLKNYPDKGWFYPDGHSRTGTHIEYKDSWISKFMAQEEKRLLTEMAEQQARLSRKSWTL